MNSANPQLDALLTAVLSSPKYRRVSPELARRIGRQELAKRPKLKEAIKATKNKLHQVGGAYLDGKINYDWALDQLRQTAPSPPEFRQTCLNLMRLHASTRERLPIIDQFYATILADLPPIHTAMDIACGLNPLAYGWMPFDYDLEWLAYDIYDDMAAFLREFMKIAGLRGTAVQQDMISAPPTTPVDLALILKTLPVLDQVDKTAVPRLLDNLQAKHILITFPARSLGGRNKGMVENYERLFYGWANGRAWNIQRFQFQTELAFLIRNE